MISQEAALESIPQRPARRKPAIEKTPQMFLVMVYDSGEIRHYEIHAEMVININRAHKTSDITKLKPKVWRVNKSLLHKTGLCCARDWTLEDAKRKALNMSWRFKMSIQVRE